MHRTARTLALALLLAGPMIASQVDAQTARVVARVFVSADATDTDVLRIRDHIVAQGGVVKGYARGEVFAVDAPAAALASIASAAKVRKVDLVPGAAPAARPRSLITPAEARARADAMPRNCAPVPPPDVQAAVAARRLEAPKPAPNALARRLSVLAGRAGPPLQVDNSLSPHFPPIGDQEGHPTCVAWAAGYYWSTYTQAANEGLDVSGTWLPRDPPCDILTDGAFDPVKFAACVATIKDPPRPSRATEHIASPAFLYPLIRVKGWTASGDKTDSVGAYLGDTMLRLNDWGVGNWQMKPYEPWRYEPLVYEWPTEAHGVEALSRRSLRSFAFQLGDDAQFEALKAHLANGNLAVGGFTAYTNVQLWGWDRSCQTRPGACPGVDNDVLYADGLDASGGHAITLVGYDDERAYVDASTGRTERGAFLVANSATPDWGVPNSAGGDSRGFFWMSYRYARSHLVDVGYNSDRPHYRPRLYAAARLAAPDRSFGHLVGGVGWHRNTVYLGPPWPRFESANVFPRGDEWFARPIESDKRLVVDLTDGMPQVDLAMPTPLLYLAFVGNPGATIGVADFYLDRIGDGSFVRMASPDPVKAAVDPSLGGVVCTDVLQTGDIDGNGRIDRTDIVAITGTLTVPVMCRSDPRDLDRDGRITVLDARRAATRCSAAGCATK